MKTRTALLVPVLFALALTVPGSWREGYLHEDEWRNAVMTRQMAATGRAVNPRLHANLVPDYPPLYFWTAVTLAHPDRPLTEQVPPIAVRFPSILGAALLALGTALLGLRFGSRRTALAAGVLVSVIPALHLEERRAMIDPLFSGLACLSVALLAEASAWTFLLGVLLLALTWLTKGPLGAAVVGLALLGGEGALFLVERSDLKGRLLRGALALIAVLLIGWAWFGYAYVTQGQEFGDNLFYTQTILRFLHGEGVIHQHEKAWSFYFKTTLPALLPIGAFAVRPRWSRSSIFAAGWFVLVLAFFSYSNTKRSYYLMPAYPAVALLAASFFEIQLPAWATVAWQTAFRWLLAAAIVVGVLLGFYARELREVGLAFALAATLAFVAFVELAGRRKPALAVASVVAFILATVSATVVPWIAKRHSVEELVAPLAKVKHFAVSPPGVHREAICFWFGASAVCGVEEDVPGLKDRPDPAKVKEFLAKYPPGEAAVIVLRRDVEGDYPPFNDPSLLPLAASDDEEASEAYVAVGRR